MTEGVDQTEGSGGAGFYQDYYANSGDLGQRRRPGRHHQHARRAGAGDRQERRQPVQGPVQPDLRRTATSSATTSTRRRPRAASPASRTCRISETHGDVGGPIWRDKLWFFVVAQSLPHRQGAVRRARIRRHRPRHRRRHHHQGDLEADRRTTRSSPTTSISTSSSPSAGLSVTTGPGSTLAQSSYAWMGNGRWQRVWSNRLFSEVNVGQWGYNFPLLPTTDYRSARREPT